MADADGEATETQVWLDFAEACGYLSKNRQLELRAGYEELGRIAWSTDRAPGEFRPLKVSCVCLLPPLPPSFTASLR